MVDDRKYTVYCHESPHGKRYVGITCQDVKNRWRDGKGYSTNNYFYRAIQKYGWDNFEHYILFEGLNQEQAENKEKELIALWNTMNPKHGYNHTSGGNVNKEISDETRAKLSAILKEYYKTHTPLNLGKSLSEDTKKKISDARKGTKWSEEQRIKTMATREQRKYKHSKETRIKMSKIMSNTKMAIERSRPVCQYDKSGNLIEVYKSMREAIRQTGVNRQQLSACCNGVGHIAKGCYWCFLEHGQEAPKTIIIPEFHVNNSNKFKPVIQYDVENNIIKWYNSLSELRLAGFESEYVRRCCNHKRGTYKGFKWEYEEGELDEFYSKSAC